MLSFFKRTENTDALAIEWLALLQSNELSEQQKQDFFCWLEADVSHQQAYIRAEQLWQKSEVLVSSRKKITGKTSTIGIFNNHPYSLFPVGIACACALLVGLFFFFQPRHEILEYQTIVGQQKVVTLSDGSELTLNTDSHARININNTTRTVFLERGEALFDVSSDESRPFDVVTRSGVVRVMGTVFSVFDNGKQTLVTVVEGRVGLEKNHLSQENLTSMDTKSSKKFSANIVLNADEQLTLEQAEVETQPKKVRAKSLISWKNKKLIYDGETLINVIRGVNRYYDIEIVIGDESIAERKLVGIIAVNDFDSTLRSLEEVLELKSVVQEQGKRVILYARNN